MVLGGTRSTDLKASSTARSAKCGGGGRLTASALASTSANLRGFDENACRALGECLSGALDEASARIVWRSRGMEIGMASLLWGQRLVEGLPRQGRGTRFCAACCLESHAARSEDSTRALPPSVSRRKPRPASRRTPSAGSYQMCRPRGGVPRLATGRSSPVPQRPIQFARRRASCGTRRVRSQTRTLQCRPARRALRPRGPGRDRADAVVATTRAARARAAIGT